MSKKGALLTILGLTLLLCACQTTEADVESIPTAITQAAATNTPSPSPTTNLATEIAGTDWNELMGVVDLGPRREIEHGGFSVEIPDGFYAIYRPATIIMRTETGEMTLSVGGGLQPQSIDLETGLQSFLRAMADDVSGLAQNPAEDITVAGQNGLAVDFQGSLSGTAIAGRILYSMNPNLEFVVVLGFSGQSQWESAGRQILDDMLASIELFSPTPMDNFCPVSADPTYGYTQENPVRVGQGDPISGPRMEQDYLNLLRGSGGESVTFARRGSLMTEDTIVDEYSLTYGDPPVTVILYLDQYHDDQFRLPQGFGCGN